jgi:ribosomal silencing factor RsfS
LLRGENREDFNQLCDDLDVEWDPQSRTEQFYVEQMAVSQWKLIRMEVVEVNIFKDTDSAKNQLPMLDRLWQAECRLERSYARAQRELERLQNSRRDQVYQPEDAVAAAPLHPAPESEVGKAVPPVGPEPPTPPAIVFNEAPGAATRVRVAKMETNDGVSTSIGSRTS